MAPIIHPLKKKIIKRDYKVNQFPRDLYAFDGRLLAEYDVYGNCLKDYIYMGSRLVAEYDPATSQYYYYTQDQLGSTRVVTNDADAVVYAAAHDPYGGIQETWANALSIRISFLRSA